MQRRKALLVGVISVILLATAGIQPASAELSSKVYKMCPPGPKAGNSCGALVAGEKYTICTEPQYLTSPFTYDALAAGSQDYTVAEYEALPGYGTVLPPLPGFIARESPATEAAIIYAPGSTANVPAYELPQTPVLQFFEGGAYGEISVQTVSGDELIGGAAPGYPEPAFNDGGAAAGITSQNDTYDYAGGTSALASAAASGATTITTVAAIPGYLRYLSFADGTTYPIASTNGTSITLSGGLTRAEAAGAAAWGNNQPPIASVASAAAQGAPSVALTASALPLMSDARVVIGADEYLVTGVSGKQANYKVSVGAADSAITAGEPVYYDGPSGAVTVEYLNISNDRHSNGATIYTGSGWTVEHDDIHDGNGAPGLGIAIGNADRGVIEYNCLAKMGDSGLSADGIDDIFDYNEIYDTNYNPDPGCGCSGGGKWVGTLNADIVDNAFVDDGPGGSSPVWLDDGNSGTFVHGNYFYLDYASSVESEVGYNLKVTGNLFVDSGWGSGGGACGSNCGGSVNLNTTGGFSVPGSRYENSVVVSGNQFINDWMGVDIWQSGQRSCDNSDDAVAVPGTDGDYCSGGEPATELASSGGEYYFSHIGDSVHGGGTTLAQPAAVGSTRVLVRGAEAIDDQIGFADPATTTTTSTQAVQGLTGGASSISASTAGFPSAGELRVGTSAAWSDGADSYTGAILSYTSTTPGAFQGVAWIRGTGTLTGPVLQVQPYRVTAQRCFANDCLVTFSPGLGSAQAAGAPVTHAGTCQLYATSTTLPAGPVAPDHVSYWDGCQWQARDISVTGNDFVFQPAVIAAGAPLTGGTGTSCTASHADACGTNFMAYQDAGEEPFSSQIDANAMMSQSGLTGCPAWDARCPANPLANLNALASPAGAPPGNGESPYNDVWSGNTYQGPWSWTAYLFGTCSPLPADSVTGAAMPPGACSPDFSQWQSLWDQDVNSTDSPSSS